MIKSQGIYVNIFYSSILLLTPHSSLLIPFLQGILRLFCVNNLYIIFAQKPCNAKNGKFCFPDPVNFRVKVNLISVVFTVNYHLFHSFEVAETV
jgi:hypothetical protein